MNNNNSNKVGNSKTQVPETTMMNDRDYLADMLESCKNMSNNFSYALNEMSNNDLYKEVFNMFNDTKKLSRELYDLMFQKGWYTLERAEDTKIQEKLNEMQGKMQQLQ